MLEPSSASQPVGAVLSANQAIEPVGATFKPSNAAAVATPTKVAFLPDVSR